MAKNAYIFRYRIRNWSSYNQALIARGRITFWFDEAAIVAWRNSERHHRRGTPRTYSDTAIECGLVLKEVFHLSLRAVQGFTASLIDMMALDLPVPHYSTLSRRQGKLVIPLPICRKDTPRHVVVDATGLKVYGDGEWSTRKHRAGRRRTWRKLHLGVDEATKEIVATELTASNVHDSRRLPALLAQVPDQVDQVSGDGAYDTRACYEAIGNRGAIATIPPRRNAKLGRPLGESDSLAARNANLRQIQEQGRYEWRVSSGCTRQSLAENAVSRLKALFGSRLSARRIDNQRVEAMLRCSVLNRMTSLGMPDSVRI